MRLLLSRLLNDLACKVLRFDSGNPFARFEQICLQDETSYAVKRTLAEDFPGRFTTISPAAVELHVNLELLSEGLTTCKRRAAVFAGTGTIFNWPFH